jgi:hypothetical protein
MGCAQTKSTNLASNPAALSEWTPAEKALLEKASRIITAKSFGKETVVPFPSFNRVEIDLVLCFSHRRFTVNPPSFLYGSSLRFVRSDLHLFPALIRNTAPPWPFEQ